MKVTRSQIEKHAPEASKALKLMAHPVRLKILCALLGGEKTVSEIVEYVDASQSWVSQFLMRMRLEGLVESRKESTFVYYSIKDRRIVGVMQAVKDFYCK